jgi:hypothetical protein
VAAAAAGCRDGLAAGFVRALTFGLLLAADDVSGLTSVPTGLTLLFAANPQFSRRVAYLNSVSGGQCSSVTISVTPFLLAMSM